MIWGASNFSPSVDHIALALFIVSSLLVLIVFVAILYFCIKYRKSSRTSRENPIEKPGAWELAISLVVFIFGLTIFIWSSITFYQMHQTPAQAREIYVVARRWVWIFRDPQGGEQINILRVPVGQPVRLIMTSEDVIHSFFVPDFRLKQDLVPGLYTSLWFKAEKIGTYPIFCAEYCGLEHSQMRAQVQVVSQEDFEHPQGSIGQSLVETGKNLFQTKGCMACHSSEHQIGPSLTRLFGQNVELSDGRTVKADENYLRHSILNPNSDIVKGFQPVMPTFQGQLSETELNALIAYLKEKKE